jgi:TonB family protein
MPRDGLPQATQDADDLAGCLPRGYRLNEFVIDRVIAEGGFGVVYSALDLRLKRRVAIKEYMPALLARRAGDFSVQPRSSVRHQDAFAVGLRSFINEARLLAQFDHPSLVRVHQFWEDKGTGFIVMPLYEGPTLKQWLAHNPPPDEAWLRAFLDRMLDALAMLHKANCLHRDVAPDNILVLKDSVPLLLDFGAARRVIDELTQSLTVIVKPGYAPIEQYADVAGIKQGPWTDLYALCATAHAIILRQPPPPAVARTVHDEMTPLSEAAFGRYSHALLAALDAGLAVRPEHRPPSVDVLRALIAAGDQDDAERTVLLSPAPAATTQDAATEEARTTPAPSEPNTAAAVASSPVEADSAPPTQPAGAPAQPQAPSLPAAFKRRSRLFELLFERPLSAHEAVFAIAAALIGVGAIALRALEAPAMPVEASAAIEAQIKPIVLAPIAEQTSAPAPEPLATAPAQTTPAEAAPLADTDLQPLASAPPPAPRVAPVRAARTTKPAAAVPAAPKSPRVAAASTVPAPATERTGAQRDVPTAAHADAPPPSMRSPTSIVEPPALDRSVATVEVPAAPPPAPNAAPPPRAALVPIAQPRPEFAAEAARDGITHGRVLARLAVDADGRVKDVRILESSPRRVFDREVRHAALRWRYQPPGEPREVDVEFVFRLEG